MRFFLPDIAAIPEHTISIVFLQLQAIFLAPRVRGEFPAL
jgi:hypothetical protein